MTQDLSHARTPEETLAALGSTPEGLTEADARERLQRFGPNALHAARQTSLGEILLDQIRGVVVLLLVAAAAISLLTGDAVDAAAIGAVLLINVTLGFVTEVRARR